MDDAARALALFEIGQLPVRYALAIDSRNLEMMVQTFSEQSNAGKWGKGRDGLRGFYRSSWRRFRRSIHTVSNHSLELTGETTAKGTVYCQGQQENCDTGTWRRVQFVYEDDYIKEDGRWVFLLRVVRFWYQEVDGVKEFGGGKNVALPESWPSWNEFWAA